MADDITFHLVDYIVMVIFLIISTLIGVYYGFYKKQTTTEEYLMGGRQLHLLPVSLSLLVTYQSAVSVLGTPAEVYIYNTMNLYLFVAIMISNVFQAYVLVPLLYPLKLTSTYEYLGRRFKSRSVQLLGTTIGMLQTLLYMCVVLLAPALAIFNGFLIWEQTAHRSYLPYYRQLYGGMRTVVWTDVFQCIILFVGLIVILIIGITKADGITNMLQTAEAGGRIKFNELSLDPRVRHTIWGVIIGGFFNWLPNRCNQACVQRICSMKSVRDAQISSLINVPLVLLYGVVLVATGVLLFAYFSIEVCDPLVNGTIDNANQLVPYLVMRVFKQVPGLSGLFIAVLFSGALSTLSSGINALSANTIHDVLANVLHGATERRKTFIAKTVVLVYGIIAVTGGYFAKGISGPIAWAISGGAGGPMTGVLFLGALFPQANWIGALCGGISGFIINMWVAVGQLVYGNKAPPSPPVPTTGCVSPDGLFSNETMHISVTETTPQAVTRAAGHLPIYDISYIYLGLLGFVVSIIAGLIVSVIFRKYDDNTTEPEYILPQLRQFWKVGYRAAAMNSKSNNDILQPLDTHL